MKNSRDSKPKIVYFCYDMKSADYYEPFKKAIQDLDGIWLEISNQLDDEVHKILHQDELIRKFLRCPIMTKQKEHLFERYSADIPAEGDLILVFTMAWADFIHSGFVTYLRRLCLRRKQRVKIVLYLLDISAHYKKALMVPYFKRIFDHIISFDADDVKKFGFVLYEGRPYAKLDIPKQTDRETADAFFCGMAKNRLPEIIEIYEQLTNEGLICDFYIVGVADDQQKYSDKIHYNQYITYRENIAHVKRSKCLVEIMQKGGRGYTFRTLEALLYKKKLITNNPALLSAPFYNKNNILVTGQSAQTHFADFLASEYVEDEAVCAFKERISGQNFAEFLYHLE